MVDYHVPSDVRNDDTWTCIRCGEDFDRTGLRKGYYCDDCLDKINGDD